MQTDTALAFHSRALSSLTLGLRRIQHCRLAEQECSVSIRATSLRFGGGGVDCSLRSRDVLVPVELHVEEPLDWSDHVADEGVPVPPADVELNWAARPSRHGDWP